MTYALVTIAVFMFSLQFLFNQKFEKEYGNGMRSALVFSIGTGITGALILFCINIVRNGLDFSFTPAAVTIALLGAVNSLLYTVCSLKAFGKINLSLYSVFAMLGGMALPFVVGILFFEEALTVSKLVCFVIIVAALFLTVEKSSSKSGFIYYAGIFTLNGMSGVLSTIFSKVDNQSTSGEMYSILLCVLTVIICLILFPVIGKKKEGQRKLSAKAVGSMVGFGFLCRVANLLILITLAMGFPASAQYPFITGGVMIFSTIICFFTGQKPSKKEILSVIVSFIGIMALVLIPEISLFTINF